VIVLAKGSDTVQGRARKEKAERKAWVEEAMEEFMGGRRCRRAVMDMAMDGYERMGCEEGEVACDICEDAAAEMERVGEGDMAEGELEAETTGVEAAEGEAAEGEAADGEIEGFLQARIAAVRAVERASRQAMDEGEELARFVKQLESWSGCCTVCRAGGEVQGHEMRACPKRGSEEWSMVDEGIRVATKELFGKRQMARFSGCFHCGLPQSLCDRWEEDGDGGRFKEVRGRSCQYKGVLVGMYVGLRARYGDEATRVVEEMKMQGGHGGGERGYAWFGGLIRWAGLQASRMCQVCARLGALENAEDDG
jgi:hypothetical protein